MGSVISGILTDTSLRSEKAVDDGLMLRAEAGKAWGHAPAA